MEFEIRPARVDEMDQLGLMGVYSYAGAFGDEADNIVRNSQRPEWTLCAFDGATMATSFAAFPFTIRANGGTLSYAGVTAVGTRPEYRRRGLLRKIMTRAFAEQRERGQCVSGLWASQAAIYQRYGYAAMGALRRYQVDTVDIRFYDGDEGSLEVRRFARTEALDTMKDLYRTFVKDRFGYLHRAQTMWIDTVLGEDSQSGPLWIGVAYTAAGEACGYVVYSLRSDKVKHAARGQEIVIRDLVWLNTDAYRSLWRYIAMHDLVGRVVWENAPIDDPLLELLQEPRMLHTQDTEPSWFRIVDVEQALANRGYDSTGEVVIAIDDDSLAPWNAGRWHLHAEAGEVHVSATQRSADVHTTVKCLAAMFTGARRATDLYHWGLLDADPNLLPQLDRLFATRYAPHCPDHY